jgi:hypothetical protein
MNIDNETPNILNNYGLDLHFMSSDKLILITSNKVGSRYSSNWFKPPLGFNAMFPVNKDFNIKKTKKCNMAFLWDTSDDEDFDDAKKLNLQDKFYDEYTSIRNNTNKKDVLFLYRNPLERVISGIVQEWFSTVSGSEKIDYKLKTILKSLPGGDSFYYKTLKNPWWISHVAYRPDFSKNELDIIQYLLVEYALEYTSTNMFQTSHTNFITSYLYNFITNANLDTNKIKLFNLDDNSIHLSKILNKYFEVSYYSNGEHDDKHKESNNGLKNLLINNDNSPSNNSLDDEIDGKLKLIKSRIINSLEIELYFYEKLKNLPYNIG